MTSIITEGRVVGPVAVRHTPSGVPTAAATLAVTDRTRTVEGRWIDRAVSYYEVTVHGQLAEGFAAHVREGSRLVVAGQLVVEEYTDRDEHTRIRQRVNAEYVGLSCRFGPHHR